MLVLLLLTVVALLGQGASLPHTHEASAPGVYNQEHDLSLLATRGADASLPTPLPMFQFVALAFAPHQPAPPAPPALLCRHANFRAPPLV
jgi:hypothetical protein